jgi:hypothetical protein
MRRLPGDAENVRNGGLRCRAAVPTALLFTLFMLFIVTVSLIVPLTTVQGAGIEAVNRVAPASLEPGAEFVVTLQLSGEIPLVLGIVETIPPGFSFLSTSCEHYEVSGQRLLLAVINETEVRYTVKAPSSGAGTFSGTWADMLSEREGSIAPTAVSVGGTATGPVSPTPSGTAAAPSAAPEVPGFEAVFTTLSLLVAALLAVVALKGGRDT